MTMTFDETIAAYLRGEFKMDFVSIALEQTREKPERLTGPGLAWQTIDGAIEVKCFASGADTDSAFEALGRDTNRVSGKIYREEDYYDCAATDLQGEVWHTSPTLITRDWSLPQHMGIVHARGVTLLRTGPARAAQPALILYFLKQDQHEWRGLLGGQTKVRVASQSFEFDLAVAADGEDRILIEAKSAQPFPSAFQGRLVEALQFIMAQTLHVGIADEISGEKRSLSLHSASSRFVAKHTFPPLETSYLGNRASLFQLLEKYLDFISSVPDQGIWHSCTNFLALARDASGLSLDAWAIGLSVAIEGSANFVQYKAPDMKAQHDDARQLVVKALKTAKVADSIQARIGGMLAQLDHIRPRDRLESLVASGHVLKDDLKSWTKLRNHSVHTREVGADDFEIENLQLVLDQVHRALRLLYAIIFHLIDYQGPYTDYAHHFSQQTYPFSRPVANA